MDNKISAKEIEEYKNFDSLLQSHKRAVLSKRLWLSMIPITIIIGTALYFYSFTSAPIIVTDPIPKAPLAYSDSTEYTKSIDTVEINIKPVEILEKPPSVVPKNTIKKEPFLTDKNQQFTFIKATPSYGMDSLMLYLNKELNNNILIPIKGTVLVAFTIDNTGNSSSIKIMQSLSEQVDNEITNLIRRMPPWKPATLNGKLVSSTITLPIRVEIKRVNN